MCKEDVKPQSTKDLKEFDNKIAEAAKFDSKARKKVIKEFAPLIKYIAGRIAIRLPPNIEMNELINAGVIGLIDAIEKFDGSKRTKFKTYAEFRIKGSILDELRSMDWVPRSIRQKTKKIEEAYLELETKLGRPAKDQEMADKMKITLKAFRKLLRETASVTLFSLDDLGEEDTEANKRNLLEFIFRDEKDLPSYQFSYADIREVISNGIKQLPEKERYVISLYYYDELTMKQIGRILKFTESRVSQIHTKAILRLRARLSRMLLWKGGKEVLIN